MNIFSSNQTTSVSEPETKNKEFNSSKYIEVLFNVLFFIMPFMAVVVFFDPYTAFRSYFVGIVALLSLAVLFWGGYLRRTLYLQRWTNYIPLIVLLFAFSLSAYFSINRNVSLFGTSQSYDQSLLFYTSVAVLYFVASNAKISSSSLLRSLSLGTLVSVFFSFLTLLGVSFPLFGKLSSTFNLVGTTGAFISLLVVMSGYSLYDVLNNQKSKVTMWLSAVTFVLTTVYVLISMDVLSILLLTAILVYVVASNMNIINRKSIFIGSMALAIALLSFILIYPQTKQALNIGNFVNSPRLSVVESWIISASTLVERPFWGTGLGTFANNFSIYRPASYNLHEYWILRMDRAFNPFFTLLSTTGLLGLVAMIVFGYFSVKKVTALNKENPSSKAMIIFIVASALSITLLGGNLIMWVALFVVLGLVLQNTKSELSEVKSPAFSVLMVGIIILISIVFGYKTYGVFASNYYVFRAVNSGNNIGIGLTQLAKAVALDEREDLYARQLVITQIQIAKILSEKKDVTDEDRQTFQNVINNSEYITRTLVSRNPTSVANWELLGLFNDSINALDKNADARAAQAYSNALARESTNPEVYMALGRVYNRQKNYQSAVNAFARAVQLKNDHANAHYNLSFALKQLGAYDLAVTELEIVDRIVPDDTEQDKAVKAELVELKKMRDDAIAKNQKQAESEVKLPVQKPEEVKPSVTEQELQNPEAKGDLELNENESLDVNVETPAAEPAPKEVAQ